MNKFLIKQILIVLVLSMIAAIFALPALLCFIVWSAYETLLIDQLRSRIEFVNAMIDAHKAAQSAAKTTQPSMEGEGPCE